jgi:hypothetical protein
MKSVAETCMIAIDLRAISDGESSKEQIELDSVLGGSKSASDGHRRFISRSPGACSQIADWMNVSL